MATATKKCRVCGKEYKACRTVSNVAGIFRWQEVACSPECGSIYLAKIEASRSKGTIIEPDKGELAEMDDIVVPFDYEEDEEDEFEDELTDYFDED